MADFGSRQPQGRPPQTSTHWVNSPIADPGKTLGMRAWPKTLFAELDSKLTVHLSLYYGYVDY